MTPRASLNRLFHAQCRDIAQQLRFAGRYWKEESWKRLLIAGYVQAEREEAEANGWPDPFAGLAMLIPGLDGETIVQLGVQTRRLRKDQLSALVECTFAYGAENGVKWTDQELIDEQNATSYS